MHVVVKETRTIAEYKETYQAIEEQAKACFLVHKNASESWTEGEPVKAWKDAYGIYVEYESGKCWYYKVKENGIEWL